MNPLTTTPPLGIKAAPDAQEERLNLMYRNMRAVGNFADFLPLVRPPGLFIIGARIDRREVLQITQEALYVLMAGVVAYEVGPKRSWVQVYTQGEVLNWANLVGNLRVIKSGTVLKLMPGWERHVPELVTMQRVELQKQVNFLHREVADHHALNITERVQKAQALSWVQEARLSKQQMSQLIGASREMVSRIINHGTATKRKRVL